jgi:hypothetical protein
MEDTQEENRIIPYLIVIAEPDTLHPRSSVIPGTVRNEDMVEFFYRLYVRFMIENCDSVVDSIEEFNQCYYKDSSMDMEPFMIYFYDESHWNSFLVVEEDLMKLYKIDCYSGIDLDDIDLGSHTTSYSEILEDQNEIGRQHENETEEQSKDVLDDHAICEEDTSFKYY